MSRQRAAKNGHIRRFASLRRACESIVSATKKVEERPLEVTKTIEFDPDHPPD